MTDLPASHATQSHFVDLTECHEISMEVSSAPLDDYHRAAIWSGARRQAFLWADAEGVDVDVLCFDRAATSMEPHTVGVSFRIDIAAAVASPASEPFRWRWSDRCHLWADRFTGRRRAQLEPRHPVNAGAALNYLHASPEDPT